MKKNASIATILLLILVAGNLQAQEPKAGDYVPFPQNKKFEGIWRFKDANNDIKFVFENKERIKIRFLDVFIDGIEGKLTYIKNNKTIFNAETVITGGVCDKKNPLVLRTVFKDTTARGGRISFTFPSNETNTILNVEFIPRKNVNDKDTALPRFPEKLTLTKTKE